MIHTPEVPMKYKHIYFHLVNILAQTYVFACMSNSSEIRLGTVKWYFPWRQYCFFPSRDTVFNPGCMEDINSFINAQMLARKLAKQAQAEQAEKE